MAVDAGYRDYVMELLAPLGGVSGRGMFGAYGIYRDGAIFAIISSDSKLYFKVDDSNRPRYEAAGAERFVPRPKLAMPYYEVPADVIEYREALIEWARGAVAAGSR